MTTTANTPTPGKTPGAAPGKPPARPATLAPEYTTGAELQTLREAAGLSREAMADLVGVQSRTVKHWEHGRAGVPADVAQVATDAAEWVTLAARRMWLQGRQTHHGRPAGRTLADYGQGGDLAALEILPAIAPAQVVMLRYSETRHMQRADLESGAIADTHGAAVVRAVQNLRTLDDIPARVVWFDTASFASWCQAHHADDTPAARQAWAEREALPAQAVPARGDQPPTSHTGTP